MNWKHTFKDVDHSEALVQYCEGQIENIAKHLLKESHCQIFYSQGKFDHQIEVVIFNPDSRFKARAKSTESLYLALDEAAEKLSKQILKAKEILQHHKKFERSKQAKWSRLNAKLEYNNLPFPYKKSA